MAEYICQHEVQRYYLNPTGYYLASGDPETMTNLFKFCYRVDAERITNDPDIRSLFGLLPGELIVEEF
jgi:hypothetical protein